MAKSGQVNDPLRAQAGKLGSLERDPNTGCKPETAALRSLGALGNPTSILHPAHLGNVG
jgi:hypothetical protein